MQPVDNVTRIQEHSMIHILRTVRWYFGSPRTAIYGCVFCGWAVALNVAIAAAPAQQAEATTTTDKVFSGPQVGEKLSPFVMRSALGSDAGKEIDVVTRANENPIVLVFVHDVNRPSISLTRILTQYTHSRAHEGLTTGVIFLTSDATAAEAQIQRMQHALTPGVATGVHLDGPEGPGSYGLNRNVMLTILVGKGGKVTGNFALVQPSLQADLPKILEAIAAVVGGKPPKLEELDLPAGAREQLMAGRPKQAAAANLRALITPVIRLNASDAEVDKAAKAVEDRAFADAGVRAEVGRIANTIVGAGKLTNYGTARAQFYLQKWARQFGSGAAGVPAEQTDKSTSPSLKE
jgi:hypothetical protein